ncbi:TetR/AcrR family transcriptional regulator [Bacillus tianshenii]|uniref:TetR/AcrR family transcriptional regulator n=1 Tax=Sutcliffiella tianshenii TaxID=1463404 RepID=UPI001CD75BE7|nr:TetR/AcrR family transcriptional regulator [Bacillus tianshenii]MCA1319125.1 TetR/AcrR family transcriptional regulator [Bacillus tianshenii]
MSPRKSVAEELTQEKIMDAARELFTNKGYQHVSMRQIATSLGYSHGALYYHFKNKAELFYAMIEKDFKWLDQWLEEVLASDLNNEEKIREVLLKFIQFGLENKSHYEMMFMVGDEDVRNYINTGPNKSYEKFAYSLVTLSNHRISIQKTWSVFLSLHGFVSHYCRCEESFEEVEPLAKGHVDFILKSLG